ncbi:MAG: tetratricopeptide (TPR) repeat protein [Myxococcota bacterium]|jgi:tetratricopeptide (TPR) repeat protein
MNRRCCARPDLKWESRVVDGQLADLHVCRSCSTEHRLERYAVSMRFPKPGRCTNCGGDVREVTGYGGATGARCTQCGLGPEEDKAVHDKLARLHPEGRYLVTSKALQESGRRVLALKLAGAEITWGRDPVAGMIKRLQLLEQLGQFEEALEEAYEWAHLEGSPTLVWGVIAQIEASTGNLAGAIKALERGLALEPDNPAWWTDYAELMNHEDDREAALRAAAKGLMGSEKARCIDVIADISERYYANGQYAEAGSACSIAGKLQEQYVELAWLRARIAAANNSEISYMVRWLKATVSLDPNHEDAARMLEPYLEKPKGGSLFDWF